MTSLLQPIGMETAYFKGGAHGGEGSGKTTTTFLAMLGIHKAIKSTKPIAVFDSEGGMSFMRQLADVAKVPLVGCRSLAFKDLAQTMVEAQEAGIECMVIDSITHPWREIVWAYKVANHLSFMGFQDWGPLKDDWRNYFALEYVRSKMHIWMCGRSGNIFEDVEEVRGGQKQIKSRKTGTRMATEGETGYEPSLLVEFARDERGGGANAKYLRRATVIKDRAFVLDGMSATFEAPRNKDGTVDFARLVEENKPFEFFRPHFDSLNLGGKHSPVGTHTSVAMYDDSASESAQKRRDAVALVLEQIPDLITKHYPGSSALDKKAKGDLLETVYQTRTWEAIKRLKLEDLQHGYHEMAWLLESCDREMLVVALGAGIEDGKVVRAQQAIDELRSLLLMPRSSQAKASDDSDLDEIFGQREETAAPVSPTLEQAAEAAVPTPLVSEELPLDLKVEPPLDAPLDPEPKAKAKRTVPA